MENAMRNRGWLGIMVLLVAPALLVAAKTRKGEEVEARLKRDVTFLASPGCEGRGPTTEGINRAANYIANEFWKAGLKPDFERGYFQPFRIAGAEGSLVFTGPLKQKITPKERSHFLAMGYAQGGKASGPLVFAGYGLSTDTYDDYAGIDVTDRIVVLLRA